MPRPRAFDMPHALACAMTVFWAKGYTATSMQELVNAMGMNRGSIYNVFADKRTLFLHVLDYYTDTYWLKPLRDATRTQPLHDVLTAIVDDILSADRGHPAGCLVTNTACELALQEPEIEKKVHDILSAMEQALLQRLEQAAQAGEVRSTAALPTTAQYLLVFFQGLMVLARTSASRSHLQASARLALSSVFP